MRYAHKITGGLEALYSPRGGLQICRRKDNFNE